ncbi:MAG: hypothetical protein R2737_00160 [Candidatus Nanopelagicales bacterium]
MSRRHRVRCGTALAALLLPLVVVGLPTFAGPAWAADTTGTTDPVALVAAAGARSDQVLADLGGTITDYVGTKFGETTRTQLAPGGYPALVWSDGGGGDFFVLGWAIRSGTTVTDYEPYQPIDRTVLTYPNMRGVRWTTTSGILQWQTPGAVLPVPPPTATIESTPDAVTVSWTSPYSTTSSTQSWRITLVPDPVEADGYVLSDLEVGAPDPPIAPIGGRSYRVTYADPQLSPPLNLADAVPSGYAARAEQALGHTQDCRGAVTRTLKAARAAAPSRSTSAMTTYLRRYLRSDSAWTWSSVPTGDIRNIPEGVSLTDTNRYSGVRTTWRLIAGPGHSVAKVVRSARVALAPVR